MTKTERGNAIAVALAIVDFASMHERLVGEVPHEIRLTTENADNLARALLEAESGYLVREVCKACGREPYDPGPDSEPEPSPSEGDPS